MQMTQQITDFVSQSLLRLAQEDVYEAYQKALDLGFDDEANEIHQMMTSQEDEASEKHREHIDLILGAANPFN